MLPNSSDLLPTVKLQDTLLKVGKLMDLHQTNLLAVVDKGFYKGIITQKLLAEHYPEQKISDILEALPHEAIPMDSDGLTAIPFFEKYQSTIFPMVNEKEQFEGYYSIVSLAKEFIHSKFNLEEGGILKIQFNPQIDSFSAIASIIEEYKALITKSFLKDRQEEELLPLLVVQVKTQQLHLLVQQLERHGYLVEQSFRLVGTEEIDQSRYELLMKYLNM